MLGTAVDIGTHVEHGGGASLGIGELPCDRGAVNALHGFEHITGNGHQGTGVTGRNCRIRFAVAYLLDGHAHGGIFFSPQGNFEGVFHGHHLGGRHQGGAGVLEMLQGLGQADQEKMGVRMACQKMAAGFQSDRRPVIPTHAIHSQGDHGVKAG